MIIRVLFEQAKRPPQLMYRLGGTARGYQGIFATLAAQQSRLWPNRTASPTVYLYIVALGVNVLNCRGSGLPGLAWIGMAWCWVS